MSRTPSQQGGHPTSDRSYLSRRSCPHQADQMPTAYHQPLPRHESRHYLSQDVGHEGAGLTSRSGSHLSGPGYPPGTTLDPRFMLASDHSSADRGLPHTLPLRMHHYDGAMRDHQRFPSGHEETSSTRLSHDCKLASHRVRTRDLETQ